jgi:hypothetical protein
MAYSSGSGDVYQGFQVESAKTWTQFHKNKFAAKPFEEYDVEVAVECCGVCQSDIHTITGGWGEQPFPLAVGHGEPTYKDQLAGIGFADSGLAQRSWARQLRLAPR